MHAHHTFRAAAAATLIATLLALSACTSPGTATNDPDAPLKIGMVVPLTGGLAPLGLGSKAAAQIMVDQLNASGGVDGHQIELTVVDDKTDVTESVKQFNQLASDASYSAMLGSTYTQSATAQGSTAQTLKIPMIALSPVSAFTDGTNPYAFTGPATPDVYAEALVDYWKSAGITKIAIGYSADVFGQDGSAATMSYAQKAGIDVVANESHDPFATDFTPLVTKVVDAAPDAFVLWSAGPPAVIIAKQLEGSGIPVYGTGAFATNLFTDPAGSAAEGITAATTAAMIGDALPEGDYRDEVLALQAAWADHGDGGYAPEFAYGGAAAIQLVAAAVESAGSTGREAVRSALESLDTLTVNGHYRFAADRHMGLDADALAITTVTDGTWVPTPYALDRLSTLAQ